MYMKPYGKYTKLHNVNTKHKDVACIIKKHQPPHSTPQYISTTTNTFRAFTTHLICKIQSVLNALLWFNFILD